MTQGTRAKRGDRAGLSEMQRRFCVEYLVDLNQTQAAIRAGYSPDSAQKTANRVFNLPQVQEYLRPLLAAHIEKTKVTAERVLEELGRIAMANIAEYYKLEIKNKKRVWVLRDLDELSPSQTAAISEIEPGKYIKLHSKDSALDKLAKHYKLYTDIDAGTANFMMMPTLKISGKEVIFEVGKPAPQPPVKKN